jgi:predicted esterase
MRWLVHATWLWSLSHHLMVLRNPIGLYLPTAYDGQTALPLLVALHGTGGDQNKYFDHETYQHGIYKAEAEKRGMVVLCPLGTDANGLPTEWRGEAEINVLAALDDVQRRFRIDSQRIVCTGQSMGGTGTTYLCCRYPDLFAAGVPLASTYGHVSLVTNLRHVPMLFVQGGKDWPIYAATGPIPITQEMTRLGLRGELWMIPNAEHNTMDVSTPRVLDWALRQTRVAHPRQITHRAYFPPHGRAWWLEIQQIDRPGWFAEVKASVQDENRISLTLKDSSRIALRPDPELMDLQRPISVSIGEQIVYRGTCHGGQELLLERLTDGWHATLKPRQLTPRTEWKTFVIGTVDQPPTWEGTTDSTLGNWLTDAMRQISGADIAICTRGHFRVGNQLRGASIRSGQTVHLMELINWLRPSDSALATFTLRGADLLRILEMNLVDGPRAEMFLVQVSGCHYRFDRRRPEGERIIESDIDPQRTYRIVCNSAAITRTDTLHLGPFFDNLNHELLEPNLLSTAWHYIHHNANRIHATTAARVVEVRP